MSRSIDITFRAALYAAMWVLCSGIVNSQTYVGGNITSNTTWTLAGSPYVVTSNLVVSAPDPYLPTVALKIEAGVEVRFQSGTGLQLGSWIPVYPCCGNGGRIIAKGSPAQHIRFTADGTGTPGSWRGISVWAYYFADYSSDDTLINCDIEFAGYGGKPAIDGGLQSGPWYLQRSTISKCAGYGIANVGILDLKQCQIGSCGLDGVSAIRSMLTIVGCTFENNAGYAVNAPSCYDTLFSGNTIIGNGNGVVLRASGSSTKFTGNTFESNNGTPLTFACGVGGNGSPFPDLDNNLFSGNADSAIEIAGGLISYSSTMQNVGMPYRLTANLSVYSDLANSTVRLRIAPGVELRMGLGVNIRLGQRMTYTDASDGQLVVDGLPSQRVRLRQTLLRRLVNGDKFTPTTMAGIVPTMTASDIVTWNTEAVTA